MKKPYLEIVRFGAEDVIATSGGAGATGADSAPSGSYYTMHDELKDAYNHSRADMDPSKYSSVAWFSIYLNGNNYAVVEGVVASQAPWGNYAWFNKGTWYSNNEGYNASISPKPEGYDSDS